MRKNKEKDKVEYTVGSGNIFADMGLKHSDELLARAEIGYCVREILEAKELKQQEIATILGIKQPDVSQLMKGDFYRFSTDKLLSFLRKLNHKIRLEISPHRSSEPYQTVMYTNAPPPRKASAQVSHKRAVTRKSPNAKSYF